MFQNEPGVAVFCYLKPNKRKHRTLRIPESVAKRIYQKCLMMATAQVSVGGSAHNHTRVSG